MLTDTKQQVRLTYVEWVDSAQPISSWSFLEDFENKSAVKCASVGWLIGDDDDVKALAPNMGGLEKENSMQVSGVIRIPTCCILRMVDLDEPELAISSPFPSPVPSSHLETKQTRQAS